MGIICIRASYASVTYLSDWPFRVKTDYTLIELCISGFTKVDRGWNQILFIRVHLLQTSDPVLIEMWRVVREKKRVGDGQTWYLRHTFVHRTHKNVSQCNTASSSGSGNNEAIHRKLLMIYINLPKQNHTEHFITTHRKGHRSLFTKGTSARSDVSCMCIRVRTYTTALTLHCSTALNCNWNKLPCRRWNRHATYTVQLARPLLRSPLWASVLVLSHTGRKTAIGILSPLLGTIVTTHYYYYYSWIR